jgi:hypothetical protein
MVSLILTLTAIGLLSPGIVAIAAILGSIILKTEHKITDQKLFLSGGDDSYDEYPDLPKP